MPSVDDRLRKVIGEALEIDPAEVGDDASPQTIGTWDSVHAITLLMSLEEEFEVTFSDQETVKMASFQAIKAALAQKGIQ